MLYLILHTCSIQAEYSCPLFMNATVSVIENLELYYLYFDTNLQNRSVGQFQLKLRHTYIDAY